MAGPEHPLVMRIEGDGFLRHMVRNIAGTLVDIGLGGGRRPTIDEILAIRVAAAGRARRLRPRGSFCGEVLYSDHKIAL